MPRTDQPSPPDFPILGAGLAFEDTPVGFRFRTVGRTVTDADITNFVGATGMVEVLFTDLEYGKAHSVIEGRLAPAALIYAMAEGLVIQASLQRMGLAFLGMELTVKAPVIAGDTIFVQVEVKVSRPTAKPGRGLVTTENTVINQRGEPVLVYTPTRLIRSRDARV